MRKTPYKHKFCNVPFRNFEVHNSGEVYSCCWVSPKGKSYPQRYSLGSILKSSVEEIWNGESAKELRRSILDESFEYCSKTACPLMQNQGEGLLNKSSYESYFWDPVNGINRNETKCIQGNLTELNYLPQKLYMNISLVCNYGCPSCGPINESSRGFRTIYADIEKRSQELIDKLQKTISEAEYMFIGSQGEPLYSKTILNWLQNASPEAVSKLCFIELQSNGSLLSEKVWNSFSDEIKKKITVIQISMDAATRETYENKNRLGGNWDNINKNLKFISSLTGDRNLTLNFLVQNNNFHEMNDFVKLAESLNCKVRFTPIQKWPAISDDRFKEVNVFDHSHPNHLKLLEVLADIVFQSDRVDAAAISELMPKKRINKELIESQKSGI